MGKETDLIPTPSRRADASYLGFLEGIREFALSESDGLDHDIESFIRAASDSGRSLDSLESIDAFMEETRVGPMRNRLMRSQQEMQWRRMVDTLEPKREQLLAEVEAAMSKGPGHLILNPDFQLPDYANVNFHLQPGGYHRDALAAHYYHLGTKIFFRGLNDSDAIHNGVAMGTPSPADGEPSRILDLACSIGQSTTALKTKFPNAEIWGIDHSAPMLKYAHWRAVNLGVDVNFSQVLAESNGFPDEHFDLVYSMILFHEIPARVAALVVAEVSRSLRPGGLFVVHDFVPNRRSTPLQLYHRQFDSRFNGEPYAQEFCHTDFEQLLADSGLKLNNLIHDGYGYMNSWWAEKL